MAFNAAPMSLLSYCCILLFCMKMGVASAGAHISYSALRGHRHRLLVDIPIPAITGCEIDMNKLNLKPLLRLCKPPFYPARGCCRGFRVVACRYYRQLNNVESNCAASLFQHIAVKGSYPTGLFNVKCHRFGNTQGLSCEGFL